jgi:hypothetical protein
VPAGKQSLDKAVVDNWIRARVKPVGAIEVTH